MPYERPTIIRREPISALLDNAKSDRGNDGQVGASDVHRKENIRPVTWGAAQERYTAPAIARRESVAGLLTVAKSEKTHDTAQSDVHLKDNVVPVSWGATSRVAYSRPGIAHREPLTGLLIPAKSEKTNDSQPSDRNIKDNIVPVRW